MPRYGDQDYWEERYKGEDTPFDWLFSYAHLKPVITASVPRDARVLVPGCGNAMLGIDMHDDGYTDTVNTDLSRVVIEKQLHEMGGAERGMTFLAGDVENMDFAADEEFDAIVEKSLLDALLCAEDSQEHCRRMMTELYRVLKPGGTYVGVSLHQSDDVEPWFRLPSFHWTVTVSRLQNPRWDEDENRDRSKYYTLLVACKHRSKASGPVWKVLPRADDDEDPPPSSDPDAPPPPPPPPTGATAPKGVRALSVPELMLLLDDALAGYLEGLGS